MSTVANAATAQKANSDSNTLSAHSHSSQRPRGRVPSARILPLSPFHNDFGKNWPDL